MGPGRVSIRLAPCGLNRNQSMQSPRFVRIALAFLFFGISFGYVEAAVVVYLRGLYEPLHERFHPGHPPGDLFPLLRLDQLQEAGPQPMRWLGTELIREAMTICMLATV